MLNISRYLGMNCQWSMSGSRPLWNGISCPMSFSLHMTADCLLPTNPSPHSPKACAKYKSIFSGMTEDEWVYYIILHKQSVYCNWRGRGMKREEQEEIRALFIHSIDLDRVGIMQEIQSMLLFNFGWASEVLCANIHACSLAKAETFVALTTVVLAFSRQVWNLEDTEDWPHCIQLSPSIMSLFCEKQVYVCSLGLCWTVMSESLWQRPLAYTPTDVSSTAVAVRDAISLSSSHCCGDVCSASTSLTYFSPVISQKTMYNHELVWIVIHITCGICKFNHIEVCD